MGQYINPENETKEEFLYRVGKRFPMLELSNMEFNEEKYVCVLVDNGIFTAGLICYCENELDYVKRSMKTDPRSKKFFLVDKIELEEYL